MKASETTKTKIKSRRTSKKVFTNVFAVLLCLVYFANVLAGEIGRAHV